MIKNAHNAQWSEAVKADIPNGVEYNRLRSCDYCGSMHPSDVAAAIKAGAEGSFASFKYGWPHKVYLEAVPNPHAGIKQRVGSSNCPIDGFEKVVKPIFSEITGERVDDYVEWVLYQDAPAQTHGKFYTEHLLDATPEERAIIEEHLNTRFEFKNGGVEWSHINK